MPFTPSHAVAILPFVRTPLAPAALVLGSMAPDIPYFAPIGISRSLSHSLVGAPTVDLLVAAVVFVLWVWVVRAPVLDYAPGWLRERMAPAARWRVRGRLLSGLLVVVALELGILSHLLLDLFTHEGGWLTTVAPWTVDEVGPFSIANLIHGIVSIAAAAVLALWVRRWVQRTPGLERPTLVGARERRVTWIALTTVLIVVGGTYFLIRMVNGDGELSDVMGTSFIRAASVVGVLSIVLVAVWHARRRLRAVHP